MASLLTPVACSRMLAAILGGNFGLDIDGCRTFADEDPMRRKVLIAAKLGCGTFRCELDADDMSRTIWHASEKMTEQLQPQVFALWQPSSQEMRQY